MVHTLIVTPSEIASETRIVRDVVYEKLKEAILTQQFKPDHYFISVFITT